MNLELNYQGVNLDLVDKPGEAIYCVFGVRKSGSSILNSIISALAKGSGQHYVDVAGSLFRGGISVGHWQADPSLAFLLRPGNVLAGFRDFPAGMAKSPLFADARKLLLVRDPRDALVSEYFSNAATHAIPSSGSSRAEMLKLRQEAQAQVLDDFVIERASRMQYTLLRYAPMTHDPKCLVLKYEDVILQKRQLIVTICQHFGWKIHALLPDQILGWADVIPSSENQNEFVRKVIPGDHIDKLKPETIANLNAQLGASLKLFGYLA